MTDEAALRAALERLLRATEFPVYEMDGQPGSGRVQKGDMYVLIDAAEQARAALAAAAPTVEPCTTCNHPYSEHTGRGLLNGKLQPDEARMGRGCEHREDFHHTCSCSRYLEPQRTEVGAAAGLGVERLQHAMFNALNDDGEVEIHADSWKELNDIATLVVAEYDRLAAAAAAEEEPASCSHERWSYDDRGNHWCSDCRIWHDFPHEAGQSEDDCHSESPRP